MNKTKNQGFLACQNQHSYFNKRGSHVGMILSFVVFITFLVFIFSILEPTFNEKKDKTTVLDYISNNIVGLISDKLVVTTIEVNYSKYKDEKCFKISYDSNSEIKDFNVVKNITGDNQLVWSRPNQNIVSVKPSDITEYIFKIYSSDEFMLYTGFLDNQCTILNSGKIENGDGYEIKSIRENAYPFYMKALKVGINASLLNETHKELGKQLKVPPGTEFSIQLIDEDGTEILGNKLDLNTEIYTRELSVEYVSIAGEIKQGKIRVNVA